MRILVLVAATGGGHKRASIALKDTFERDSENEVLIEDGLKYCSKFLDFSVTKGYMFFATKAPKLYGKVYNSADKPSFLDKCVHKITAFYAKRLMKIFDEFKPDCVVSCHAFCNNMVATLKERKMITCPLFNIVTDFAPHSSYINDYVDFYIVSSNDMVQQMHDKYNIDESMVYPLGIPVFDYFYDVVDKAEVREKLGLNPHKKTVLMMAGSFGVKNIIDVYRNLNKLPSDYQMIVVTGRNEKLFSAFQNYIKDGEIPDKKGNKVRIKIPTKLCYFVTDIENHMSAADIIITKPGGLTVSESMAKELPMAIFRSYDGQEKENADFLERHNLAMVLEDGPTCAEQINDLIADDERLKTMHNNIHMYKCDHSSQNIYKLIKEKV